MKEHLIKLFDHGCLKIGQKVPMTNSVSHGKFINEKFEIIEYGNPHQEEIIITESFIQRLRTEVFETKRKYW